MKKGRFVHEFALVLLLALAIGAIALHSQFNNNLTGYAVLGEYRNQTSCEAANYSWYNNTCNSAPSPVCDSTHLTLCLDNSTCTTATGYWYNSVCNSVACSPSWTCTDWTNCSNGNQTRTCTDANNCGTTTTLPIVKTCSSDTTTTQTTQTTTPITVTCTPNWQCGDWQECVSGNQARACTDTNNCGTQDGIPSTSQACIVPIVENCSDKIKNQGETGVDCGGPCKKCGIFTIVGSAISGPLGSIGTSMQKIFSNKTNIFIASGALAFVVCGFFTFRFFRKHKLKIVKN